MIKYVFEEYRDKMGTGSEKLFDSEQAAVDYAKDAWLGMVKYDRDSYKKDSAGMFNVYAVEITDEQVEQYNNGELEISFAELWTADICNFLEE